MKKNKKSLLRPYQKGDENRLHWYDKNLVAVLSNSVVFWEKYFRYEIVGLENIPQKKGALLANNHGLIMFDMLLLARRLVQIGHPPRALAEHATWKIPFMREIFLNMGVVDGSPKNAIRLLRAGETVIVFPGGAREGLKPSTERYELFWRDKYGFIKVAIASGVPIVPCFSAGIDHCYFIINNGYELGKKLFGTYLPLPIFMGLGAMPFPVKIKHYIGKPITHKLPRQAYRDEKVVKKLHAAVLKAEEDLKKKALKNYRPVAL
jgi:1-acyl-sn-glycerol-3-phosphate acyltransferase